MSDYEFDEPEFILLDDVAETDIYGNAIIEPEWSGEVDGEELLDFLLSEEDEDEDD